MHPILAPIAELPFSWGEALKRKEKSSQQSPLCVHHAQSLAAYIKRIFLAGELLGERVEPSWTLNSPLS